MERRDALTEPGDEALAASAPAVASWVRILVASALALGVVALVPRTGSGGSMPAVQTMLLTGGLLAAVIGPVLYLAVRRHLRLGVLVAICFVAYNLLVIVVKFVLAPRGLYEVNQVRDLNLLAPDSGMGAVLTAIGVGLVYLTVYVVLYRLARRRIAALLHPGPGGAPRRRGPVVLVSVVVVFACAIAGLGTLVLAIGGGAAEYLVFVFSSAVSGMIALAIAVAIALAGAAFTATAERARAVGDAALLASLFWLGLYFLALYHALWVVYILVVTSIWPLKVVIPK